MADNGTIDVLMKVVNNRRALAAESRTEFVVDKVVDRLREGFDAGQYCDLQEFSFAVGVANARSKKDKDAKEAGRNDPASKSAHQGRDQHDAATEQVAETIDAQPVEFTRIFDTSSTLLFNAMVACDTIDTVSIIKRKAAGTSNSGEIYMRADFGKVLITELTWKDGEHVVLETGTFIYRELTLRYRPQRPDGSLGVVVSKTWPK